MLEEPIDTLQQRLRCGSLSSLQLLEESYRAIEEGEASAFTNLYKQKAVSRSKSLDDLLKAQGPTGPLHGIPVSIKALFDVKGDVTDAGSLALMGSPPARENAEIVDRLENAGAVIVGKNHMSELAFTSTGYNPNFLTPRAPFDRKTGRLPGGSSSGSGVAVADGHVAAAIGTDTGGSVRIPAAWCGVTGFKPTSRFIPMKGCRPLAPSFDSIGPLARSVDDCWRVYQVLAGVEQSPLDAVSVQSMRLAVPAPGSLFLSGMDPEVAKAFDASVDFLREHGVDVTELDLRMMERTLDLITVLSFTESTASNWDVLSEERMRDHTDENIMDSVVRERLEDGASQSAADYIRALQTSERLRNGLNEICGAVDAIIIPTVPVLPPPIEDVLATPKGLQSISHISSRNTRPANFLNRPAVSLPCHLPGEAPVGVQIMGHSGQDKHCLEVAKTVEMVLRLCGRGAPQTSRRERARSL
mmetsp:Transcript_3682/g.13247  ORF Transcript_3682/g.13247 Transcript_3682/m.13247 type:complete len:471 (+) Transcript_3682:311-1723(+)